MAGLRPQNLCHSGVPHLGCELQDVNLGLAGDGTWRLRTEQDDVVLLQAVSEFFTRTFRDSCKWNWIVEGSPLEFRMLGSFGFDAALRPETCISLP